MPQSKEINKLPNKENSMKSPDKGDTPDMDSRVEFRLENTGEIAVPEKFKDPKTGELKVQDLLKSYIALEKKLSERPTNGAQGVMPASAQEYDIQLKSDLITSDPQINERLFKLGFTNEQVQAVYDLAVEKILPLLEELSADYKADKELSALEAEFGGAEQFNTIARQVSAWGEKNLSPDIFNALCCSKDGILTMYKMMGGGSEPSLMKEPADSVSVDTEESLRTLMRDPKYWRKNDPATVKRVEEGFKRLYK